MTFSTTKIIKNGQNQELQVTTIPNTTNETKTWCGQVPLSIGVILSSNLREIQRGCNVVGIEVWLVVIEKHNTMTTNLKLKVKPRLI